MLTHGGDAVDEAIQSSERRFHVELLVDWNKNGQFDHELSNLSPYVQRVSTDRSLKGSAPEELLLVEGAAAGELIATLGGEDWTGVRLAPLFSPYNGNSPLYMLDPMGAEIVYRIGVETHYGVVWYPQFVGSVRTVTPNRADNTVELTALDRVELLRRPVRFPSWAISEVWQSRGYQRALLCDSQWVIDHCLRFSDISPTPHRPTYREEMNVPENTPDGVHFWLSGTGSHLPSIGWMDNPEAYSFPHTEETGLEMFNRSGAFSTRRPTDDYVQPLALNGLGSSSAVLKYWVSDRDLVDPSGTHYLGFTMNLKGSPDPDWWKTARDELILQVRIGLMRVLEIYLDQGHFYSDYVNEYQGSTFRSDRVPVSPDVENWVRVYAIWLNSPSAEHTQVYLQVGSNSNGGFKGDWPAFTGLGTADPHKGLITVYPKVSLNDVFYGSRNIYNPSPSATIGGFRDCKYVAVLDPGLNRFTYMPAQNGDDAWDVITRVAAAEYGSVFWDEEGVFRFWNYDRISQKKETIVREFTLDQVDGLQLTNSFDSVRNVLTYEVNKQVTRSGRVLEAETVDQFVVPARQTRTFRIYVDNVQTAEPAFLMRYTTDPELYDPNQKGWWPRWTDSVDHGYCLQYFYEGRWQENNRHSNFDLDDISVYHDRDGHLVLKIRNGWSEDIRLADKDGNPALRVKGTVIAKGEPLTFQQQDDDSVRRYGARNFRMSGDWYQDSFQTEQLVNKLLQRTVDPIPTTDAITIPGDPRLQLGDTIRVSDPEGFGERMDLQIYGINRVFDVNQGLTDTLTVEMVRPSRIGYWDSPQYGRWDETFIWS